MSLFGRKKQKPYEPYARESVPPPLAPAPTELDATHPVFRLKAGMGREAVVGLLGADYLSTGDNQLLGLLSRQGQVFVMNDAATREECWLYANTPPGYDIEIVFRSGSLASAEVKERTASGRTLVMRID